MTTHDRHAFTVLREDGRRLLTDLPRRAANTVLRWVRSRREAGASDDAIERELREKGLAVRPPTGSVPEATPDATRLGAPPPERPAAPAPPAHDLPTMELLSGDDLVAHTLNRDTFLDELSEGVHDDQLDELWRVETGGRARPDELEHIENRRAYLAALDILDGTLDDLDRFLAVPGSERHARAMVEAERSGKNRKGAIRRLSRLIDEEPAGA